MKKLLSLLGAGILVAMWSGCGVTDPVSAPRITIDALGTITITSNDVEKWVIGKIEADTAISSISATVETAAGVAVPSTQIAVTTAAGNGEKTQNLTATSGIKLTIKSAAQSGDYKLKITVDAGATATASFDFKLAGNAGTAVTTATVTMGSYANTGTGSSIDLDGGTVMLAGAACTAGSGVDLVATYSANTAYLKMRLFTPVYARDNSGIVAFSVWPDALATSIVQVTGTTFASITTAEQIETLYAAGTPANAFACVQGDVVIVKTNLNKYVAIEVGAYTATTDGTFTLKYAK